MMSVEHQGSSSGMLKTEVSRGTGSFDLKLDF